EGATSPTCSARSPKSADSTDGAIRTSPGRPASRVSVGGPPVTDPCRSAEARPAENALEPVEIRLALPQRLDQPLPIPLDELREELGAQLLAVGRQQTAHHPLDHLARGLELVTVDLHAHDLVLCPEFTGEVV